MPTVVELLRKRADTRPTDRAYYFVDESLDHDGALRTRDSGDSDLVFTTYRELDTAARKVAAALIDAGATGTPVLLLYPPGREYVIGFLGCLYAGALAVPAYPPDPSRLSRTLPRLRALMADCGAHTALSMSGLAEAMEGLLGEAPQSDPPRWMATDALPASLADSWTMPAVDPRTPALLQYTSGSTGTPKGVLLTHANLLHNSGLIHQGFGSDSGDIGVSWLPPYHDMGLIGGILQPLYGGFPVALMSPLTFLRRPLTWLETISQLGATISGGPNFAFDLCVRKTTPQQRAALDLSRWSVAFCGAEPVRTDTLERFTAAFAPAGFRWDSFYPCYGLAEATLIVTGGQRHAAPSIHRADPTETTALQQVTCGRPLGGQHLLIVDPQTTTPCPAGTVGEIWVSGPSVAQGYWGREQETRETFQATTARDPDTRYLRTGDLGFLDPTGELVVTGRRKDLIIIRGRNIHPHDVERTVESEVPWLRPGCCAAFEVAKGDDGRVGFVCEVARRSDGPAPDDIIAAIRQTVAEAFEVRLGTVVLLEPGQVPKTSSGKIQRYACRQGYAAGDFSPGSPGVVACWEESGTTALTEEAIAAPESRSLAAMVARVLELPVGEVSPDAPLTRLGLDSLRAIDLRHALESEHGVVVPLSDLLGGVDLATLGRRIPQASLAPAERPPGEAPCPDPAAGWPDPGQEYEAAASDGQRALWFMQRWAPDARAYQISRAAKIRSTLDLDRLEHAFRLLVDGSPALRTSLPARNGEPVQRVTPWTGPVLTRHDATGLTDDELRGRVQDAAGAPFDLAEGPLFRAAIFTRAHDDHVLLLTLHHAITDFWSLSVMVRDLLGRYRGDAGPEPTAAPHPAARQDPATEQNRLAYWRRVLHGVPPALDLPTTFPRPRVQSLRGARVAFRLDADLVKSLDAFARQAGVTRFVTLLAGFAAVLARHAGDDVVIGTPTAGRDTADSRDRLGYHVNPVPLRIAVPPGVSFRRLVDETRGTVLGALDHAVPFPRLVEALRPTRDPGRPVLAQTMLVLHQPPAGMPDLGGLAVEDESGDIDLGGLRVTPLRLAPPDSPFDLSLVLAEVAGDLSGVAEYCADLFDQTTVSGLTDHLRILLTRALAEPDAPLDTLELLDDAARDEVLSLGYRGPVAFSDHTTLPQVFARQVARRPNAPAVVSGDRSLTYSQLDQRAERLAVLLRARYGVGQRGAGPDHADSIVGVLLRRDNPDALVAFWAILKAGGGYLPLDPQLPANRIAWLINDAGPVVVVTESALADRLPDAGPTRCSLDEVQWSGTGSRSDGTGTVDTRPDDLAYVIYTSGSTGRPKGVLLSHRGACNLGESLAAGLGLTETDRMLQYASCGFDASIAEILMAHLCGAALHLAPPEAVLPGPALVNLLNDQRITAAILPPATLTALPDTELPHLARLMSAGESCPAGVVARWSPGRRFLNAYGPTEATVCGSWHACEPGLVRPPIGAPMSNVRAYVLDPRLRPVPVGVPGELHLGGVGVGRGYLGRPGLTARHFLPDPFSEVPGARMYRTGDRVRWLPGGLLDFLGRTDEQVKIRGVRVEPGEVAARLSKLSGLREVAVVARPRTTGGDEAELIAYLVADGQRPPVAELRGLLRAELPEPLVPSAYVCLDRLPRNPSGKLDRAALPAPTLADRGLEGHVPPRTPLETTVARVWAAVLGQPEVGVRAHFFDELGGSSLLVPKVAAELSRLLGRQVPVTHLFEHPTVETLACRLAAETDSTVDPDADAERVAESRRRALARHRDRRAGKRGS